MDAFKEVVPLLNCGSKRILLSPVAYATLRTSSCSDDDSAETYSEIMDAFSCRD
jgi:hypothetical protein